MDRYLFNSWFETAFIPHFGTGRHVILVMDNNESFVLRHYEHGQRKSVGGHGGRVITLSPPTSEAGEP